MRWTACSAERADRCFVDGVASREAVVDEGPEDRPLLSHSRRLAGMLFEPRRAMEDLARRPRWILPVVLSQVPPAIFSMSVIVRAGTSLGDDHSIRSLSPEIGDALLTALAVFPLGVVNLTAMLLVSAFAMTGLFRALSRTLSMRHALALCSYSLVPGIVVGLAHRVLQAGLALLQLESPLPHWFWLNAASFLDWSEAHPLAYSLAREIGALPLWRWLLVALGLTIMVRSVSFRIAFGVAVVALVSIGSIWNSVWISAMRLFIPEVP